MHTERTNMNWETAERLDWHLWILAILLIFVLGVSLLGFMFPTAFWFGQELPMQSPQRAFFGFCVLLALVLVYLLQRQATVRRLKRQLFEAQAAVVVAEREATTEAFLALPGTPQFRDALAMEFRRASNSESHLAEVLFTAPNISLDTLGRLAKHLRSVLRRGESLYRISDKAVAVILPGMQLADAASFAADVEGLAGIPKNELEVTVKAFPEDVSSLAELEARIRSV